MKFVLLSLLFVALALAKTQWFDLHTYSFAKYTKEFTKVYSGSEYEFRQKIFEERLAEIMAHNRNPTKTWKMGVNHLTDRTPEEFKKLLGYKKQIAYASKAKNTVRSTPMSPSEERAILKALPNSVDWRQKNVVSPVKNQGECGSCWTFGTSETIESHWAIATGLLFELSEQQILDCTPNPNDCGGSGGCEGGTAEIAYAQIMQQGGLTSEWMYPYTSFFGQDFKCHFNQSLTQPVAQLSNYVVLPSNEYAPVMSAIATKGPLAVSVDASAWASYESGVFDGCNQTNPDLDHEVQLVGYGTDPNYGDYWLVRNSWSPAWGEAGYIRLRRTSTPRCGVDITPQDGTGCNNGPSKIVVCGTCGILYDVNYPIVQH